MLLWNRLYYDIEVKRGILHSCNPKEYKKLIYLFCFLCIHQMYNLLTPILYYIFYNSNWNYMVMFITMLINWNAKDVFVITGIGVFVLILKTLVLFCVIYEIYK